MKRVLDVTSPYDRVGPAAAEAALQPKRPLAVPARGVAMDGAIRLAFDRRDGETRLAELHQQAPLRAFFPREAGAGELQAVLANVAGGLVGGDSMSVAVTAADGAQALVTTQAAEKVYRSAGPEVCIDCQIGVTTGAALAWLPQPTILFDGAVFKRRTRVSLAPGASVHAGEIVAFGRAGSGERLASGRLFDAWEVRRAGRLVWADRMLVEDWPVVRDDAACIAGARSAALFIHAGDDAAGRLDEARALTGDAVQGLTVGATVIDGLLIVRWLGRDTAALLNAYTDFWRRYRATADASGGIPRIWAV
jgi:urease accessory protein